MKDKHKSPYRIRGGSWYDDARSCRSAFGSDWRPGIRYDDLGFRVVFKKGTKKEG